MQPDAARAVEGWLQNASEEGLTIWLAQLYHYFNILIVLEREVATRLFTNMESRQGSRPPTRTLKRSTSAPTMRPPSVLGNEG